MKQKESKKIPNLYLLVLSGLFLTLVIGGFLGSLVYNNKGSSNHMFYSIQENYCKDGYNYAKTYCNGTVSDKPKCCPGGLNHLNENGECSDC